MAREYAKVKVAIWADDDFRRLTAGAQCLYFTLLTSPTLKLTGVADWRPKRVAALAHDMTARKIQAVAAELSEHQYVVVDDDMEEALVRSFLRHDGVLKSPNITAAMVKDFAAIASPQIRRALILEMHRLRDKHPDWKGWPVADDLLANHPINRSEMVPETVQISLPEGSERSSVNGSPIPQPSTLSQQPAALGGAKRAHQLPDDWSPNDTHRGLCAEFGVDVDRERLHFIDFHTAKGSKFKDWDAAFRTWIRNSNRFGGHQGRPNSGVDWDASMARAQAREGGIT